MLHIQKNIEIVSKIQLIKIIENELSKEISKDVNLANVLSELIEKYRLEYRTQKIGN